MGNMTFAIKPSWAKSKLYAVSSNRSAPAELPQISGLVKHTQMDLSIPATGSDHVAHHHRKRKLLFRGKRARMSNKVWVCCSSIGGTSCCCQGWCNFSIWIWSGLTAVWTGFDHPLNNSGPGRLIHFRSGCTFWQCIYAHQIQEGIFPQICFRSGPPFTTQSVQALSLASSCPFNKAFTPDLVWAPEDSDVCYHGSTPLPLLLLLCWPSSVHSFIPVFVREGRWQRLYGPPGSCKRWLTALWCSRCNSSFCR